MGKRICERPVGFFAHLVLFLLAIYSLGQKAVDVIINRFHNIANFPANELATFKVFLAVSLLVLTYHFLRFAFYLEILDDKDSDFSKRMQGINSVGKTIEWCLRLFIWVVFIRGIGEYLYLIAGWAERSLRIFGLTFSLQYNSDGGYKLNLAASDDYLYQLLKFALLLFALFIIRDVILLVYSLIRNKNEVDSHRWKRFSSITFDHASAAVIFLFLLFAMYCEQIRNLRIPHQVIGALFTMLFLANVYRIQKEYKTERGNGVFPTYIRRIREI